MGDLTIIYITANQMPEHWCRYQQDHLLRASCGARIICISRAPTGFGDVKVHDSYPQSYWNIYRQLRIGTEMAETKYVAMAEDDVLYSDEHFREFRPPDDAVAYDRSRWSLFTWDAEPIFCLRNRISNCGLIAPREYLLDALREREKRWPDGFARDDLVGEVGRGMVERNLDVGTRTSAEWWSTTAIVQLNHVEGTDARQRERWKKHGQLKAIEIPHWGRAANICKIYRGER